MRNKNIVTYFILFMVCPSLVLLNGCQKTSINLTKRSKISNGQFTAQINGLKLSYTSTFPVLGNLSIDIDLFKYDLLNRRNYKRES
jgi:hypothetical protein